MKTDKAFIAKIDNLLRHPVLGVLIFFIVLWIVFQATFGLGYYPMIWIEKLIFLFEDFLVNVLPDNFIKSLLLNGILKGVGGVVIFLPNIVILFSLISVMEESGYMARVTLVMERIMKPFGLNGRSFISMVMGLGCNVPAIMAAQDIKNRNSRLITILVNPLISCSSRFTVYVLFISAFFPERPGTILFMIYCTSVIIAFMLSLFLKKFFLSNTLEGYEMFIPELRAPSVKRISQSLWFNSKLFLSKITGAILIASVIIWCLSYFPNNSKNDNIEGSYLGNIGKFIEPAISPLGFDWRMGISIISGVVAKETIAGSLSQLYQKQHVKGDDKANLVNSIKQQTFDSGPNKGKPVFSALTALAFMFFVAIYTPCIATLTTIRKTTGSRKWTLMTILYTTAIAWVVSFLIFNFGSFLIG